MAKAASKKPAAKAASKKGNAETAQTPDANFTSQADESLQDLFLGELKDTYWAENHLVKAIPKMIAAAGASELKQALSNHLEETANHAARLENVFELLGAKIVAKKCDAMEGLTMSGEHVIENTLAGTPVRDLGIIMAGLKVEQFEIITYKGLIQVATTLGLTDAAALLQQNLDEELNASNLLSNLSQTEEPA